MSGAGNTRRAIGWSGRRGIPWHRPAGTRSSTELSSMIVYGLLELMRLFTITTRTRQTMSQRTSEQQPMRAMGAYTHAVEPSEQGIRERLARMRHFRQLYGEVPPESMAAKYSRDVSFLLRELASTRVTRRRWILFAIVEVMIIFAIAYIERAP